MFKKKESKRTKECLDRCQRYFDTVMPNAFSKKKLCGLTTFWASHATAGGTKTCTDHDAPVLVEVVKSRVSTRTGLSVPSDLLAINPFVFRFLLLACRLVLVVILILYVENANSPRSQSSEGERRCYLIYR
jgi:hypothetical protein